MDNQMLRHLVTNGRASYSELAREVHLTRTAVRERVNRLIEEGVIEGFTARVNPRKLGRNLSVFIEIDIEPNNVLSVGHALAEDPDVLTVHQMTGPSTLHVHVSLRDHEHLREFLYTTVYSLKGVTMVKTYILLNSFKRHGGGLQIR